MFYFWINLQEFPYVRYRAAKTLDASVTTTQRDLVPTKLAAAVWNCLSKYRTTIPDFPQKETCELLIVDRSIDQVCHTPIVSNIIQYRDIAWVYNNQKISTSNMGLRLFVM